MYDQTYHPKPDCLNNRITEPEEEENCKYLEPVQRHEYAEPTSTEESEIDSEFHDNTAPMRQPNTEEDAYEPVGSMEELE